MIPKLTYVITFALLSVITLPTIIGCTSKPAAISANTPSTQATPTPQAMPVKLTAEDLKKVRWIEGTWRGTGVSQPAFFERYRWENDTMLAVDSFEDEKLEKVTDTTRFELKDGEFGGGSEGSRYVATALDDNAITFGPVVKARNSFVWKRESKTCGPLSSNPSRRPTNHRRTPSTRWNACLTRDELIAASPGKVHLHS